MSQKSQNIIIKNIKEPINHFDDEFLNSKDLALQPISFLFESDCDLNDLTSKTKHLSLKHKNKYEKQKSSDRSKRSKNTQKSEKSEKSEKSKKTKKSSQKSLNSQKSTSNTNKKLNSKKTFKESNLYSSNIVIVHNDDDCSSTDPIEKEVEKLKKLIAKRERKKKKTNKDLNNIKV